MTSSDTSGPARVTAAGLRQLYPQPREIPLEGLYLCHDLRRLVAPGRVYVYSNFITSLDGRIAVAPHRRAEPAIPDSTANPRDWRLLLELAAPADALIVSGRYLRQLGQGTAQAPPPFSGDAPADLVAHRAQSGLPVNPALVIVSNSLDLPLDVLSRCGERRTIVATSRDADMQSARRLSRAGIDVVRTGNVSVDGDGLVAALQKRRLSLVYSIAGPAVMHTLLEAGVLRRLYLTTVLRVLSGAHYATMATGRQLDAPYDFRLAALYLDNSGPDDVQQLLQVFDRRD